MSEVYYFGDPKLKPKDDQAFWYKAPPQEATSPTDEKLREKFFKVEINRQGKLSVILGKFERTRKALRRS